MRTIQGLLSGGQNTRHGSESYQLDIVIVVVIFGRCFRSWGGRRCLRTQGSLSMCHAHVYTYIYTNKLLHLILFTRPLDEYKSTHTEICLCNSPFLQDVLMAQVEHQHWRLRRQMPSASVHTFIIHAYMHLYTCRWPRVRKGSNHC